MKRRGSEAPRASTPVIVDPRQLALELLAEIQGPRSGLTFGDYWPRYLKVAKSNRQTASTLDGLESIWRNHLVNLAPRTMESFAKDDEDAIKARLFDRKPKTVNNVLAVVSGMFTTAVERGDLPRAPVKIDFLPVTQPPIQFFDFEQYAELVDAAHRVGPEVEVFVLLGGDAGLRTGELIALEWPDIHLAQGYLTVRRADWRGEIGPPKGKKIRDIPLTIQLRDALEALPKHRGRVLRRPDGEPVSEMTLRTWMRWAMAEAGFPVKPRSGAKHILRHTFCSHLAMRGASAISIQELAGHVDLRTTQRYMHLAASEKRRAIGLLDKARGR